MKHWSLCLPLCLPCMATLALAATLPQPVPQDGSSPKRPPLSAEYRHAAGAMGRGALYPNKSEAEVYRDVKLRDMHYRYVAFLEMFPSSAHKAEIESLVEGFLVFGTSKRMTVSIDEMKSTYNYDGDNSVSPWNMQFGTAMISEKTEGVWRAPLCYGNLQFLSGGFVRHKTSLELLPGTEFIYPSKK